MASRHCQLDQKGLDRPLGLSNIPEPISGLLVEVESWFNQSL